MTEHPSSQKTKPVVREARQLTLDELIRPPQTEHSLSIDRTFPEQFVNALSRQEVFNKHLFRPNTYLHKWWARRCGSTFRTILKQFTADRTCRDYYAPGGLEGITVLDPMMGGGTTLHEAIRLGANVIGADIDPIPIVQARAALTPAGLTNLRAAFKRFFFDLHQSLEPYFQTECPTCEQTIDIQYVLHGLRKKCACRNVVQIDQYDLRHEDDAKISICPESGEIFRSQHGRPTNGKIVHLITKAEKKCPICGQQYAERLDLPFYARYTPIAIVATCSEHGHFFRSPSAADLARIKRADERRSELDFGPLEDFTVQDGPKSGDLLRRNIHSYLDVFSSRQLLYLHQAIQQLRDYAGIESYCWHQQLYEGVGGHFRRVRSRLKETDRADGIYLPPLGPQRVGRTHVGAQKCRVQADECLRGVLRTSYLSTYPQFELNPARQHFDFRTRRQPLARFVDASGRY